MPVCAGPSQTSGIARRCLAHSFCVGEARSSHLNVVVRSERDITKIQEQVLHSPARLARPVAAGTSRTGTTKQHSSGIHHLVESVMVLGPRVEETTYIGRKGLHRLLALVPSC